MKKLVANNIAEKERPFILTSGKEYEVLAEHGNSYAVVSDLGKLEVFHKDLFGEDLPPTYEYWFSRLPEADKEAAIENLQKFKWVTLDKEIESLPVAIMTAFAWGETSEGRHYWVDVYEAAEGGVYDR